MEELSILNIDIVRILWFLLPGFVAAWVFEGLMSRAKASQFERFIEALIFTAFTQVLMFMFRFLLLFIGRTVSIGEWTQYVELSWLVLLGVILGLLFSFLAHNDTIHRVLRNHNFTNKNSFHTTWLSIFSQNKGYVVLHLSGKRRLYGFPDEWPNDPGSGFIALSNVEWLLDEHAGESEETSIKLDGVGRIMIPVEEIEFIEFMKSLESTETRED